MLKLQISETFKNSCWLVCVTSLLSLAGLAALWWCGFFLQEQLQASKDGQTQLTARINAANVEAAQHSSVQANVPKVGLVRRLESFAQRLPAAPIVHEFLHELQRLCAANGVQLINAISSPRGAAVDKLGLAELSVSLSGSYANIKVALRDALARHDSGLLSRLSLRRLSATQDIEVQASVLLLARPANRLQVVVEHEGRAR